MPSENRRAPKGVNMVLFSEASSDPIGLMGPGLPEGFQEASGQGKGDSNPLPWSRDEAVQGTVIRQGSASPSVLRLTQREVPLRTLLSEVALRTPASP